MNIFTYKRYKIFYFLSIKLQKCYISQIKPINNIFLPKTMALIRGFTV